MKLKNALAEILDERSIAKLVTSFDRIGEVIVIRIPPELQAAQLHIAEALHTRYPKVRTIAAVPLHAQTDERYRTRDLTVIWGDPSLETTYCESGCRFKADLKQVFLSPRLSYERMRIARKVAPAETVLNLFAGVGCFSILIAKLQPQATIYSVDVNPHAFAYLQENVALNRVEGRVIPILGDAVKVAAELQGRVDRVLMPLPETAHAFLPAAVRALRLWKGGDDEEREAGTIHYYAVARGRSTRDLFTVPFARAEELIAAAFDASLRITSEEQRIVRSVGPRKYHVVLDLRITRERRS
ncbi:MAG TPA: class I SAM-dependent methyltransferase family protein [Methanomicrobia archaeon]|nr:class I SAM-dependent methyltransferase family protein [Methanomicrobia archaeon]